MDTLEYQPAKPQYHPTSEDHAWRIYRFGYYGLQLLLLLIVSFRIGPNLIFFHSPLSPGPTDYVPLTNDYVPMIAAIKAYQRDFGKLPAMFCRRCYANLNQATHSRCARCGRAFNADEPASYLPRPFPSRRKMIVHTLVTLILSTLVSFVVAGFLALAQLKYIHSGH